MSYCRFSNAGIYVFPSRRGFECCGCPFNSGHHENDLVTTSAAEMIRHMAEHRVAGHYVPDFAFRALFADRHLEFEGDPFIPA